MIQLSSSMLTGKSFSVAQDYTLNGGTLTIPAGYTLQFDGGTISNGSIVLDNVTLTGTMRHSIDAVVTGTVTNKTIKMSWFSDVNNVRLTLSNQVIQYDEDAVITQTVVVPGNNITYDGMGHSFICNVTFFSLTGKSNITIKNFNASVADSVNPVTSGVDFQKMVTTTANVTGIHICNNHIKGFRVGMSLNTDSASYHLSDSTVTDNVIENPKGTRSGQGYGIHLANARNCIVSGNTIINADRHSIYHAYGDGNQILDNYIIDHRKDHTGTSELVPRAAIAVFRKSTNLTIMGNRIVNSYNVGIHVHAFPSSYEGGTTPSLYKYGCAENIVIENNSFITTNISGNLGGLPSVMIGYIYNAQEIQYSDYADSHIENVEVINNFFLKASTEALQCIRIDQCISPFIYKNLFRFVGPSTSHEAMLIRIHAQFKNVENMVAAICNNTFSAINTISNYTIYAIGNLLDVKNSLFDITVSDNVLLNHYVGNSLNYRIYKPVGIASQTSNNLHLQSES